MSNESSACVKCGHDKPLYHGICQWREPLDFGHGTICGCRCEFTSASPAASSVPDALDRILSGPRNPNPEWVTVGRIKVDVESETETFERIDPSPAEREVPERIWIDSWDAEYHLNPRDEKSVEYTRVRADSLRPVGGDAWDEAIALVKAAFRYPEDDDRAGCIDPDEIIEALEAAKARADSLAVATGELKAANAPFSTQPPDVKHRYGPQEKMEGKQ